MSLILTNPVRGGYLEIDHRNTDAPLPPGVQRYMEADTYTCLHCQAVVVMNPARVRERYKCSGCNHLICDGCAAERYSGAPCKTFAQKADEHLTSILRKE